VTRCGWSPPGGGAAPAARARSAPERSRARQRIAAQPLQSEKIRRATVIIDNSGSLEETRQQVTAAFRAIELSRKLWYSYARFLATEEQNMADTPLSKSAVRAPMMREPLATSYPRATRDGWSCPTKRWSSAWAAKRIFWPRRTDRGAGRLRPRISWGALKIWSSFPVRRGLRPGVPVRADRERGTRLECEVLLLYVPVGTAQPAVVFYQSLGFSRRLVNDIPVPWRQAAEEFPGDSHFVMAKQLRALVTKPI